jgi:hypothetical protein
MTRYTVRLEDDTIGVLMSEKSESDLVGARHMVVFHDCNGMPSSRNGLIVEVSESEVMG